MIYTFYLLFALIYFWLFCSFMAACKYFYPSIFLGSLLFSFLIFNFIPVSSIVLQGPVTSLAFTSVCSTLIISCADLSSYRVSSSTLLIFVQHAFTYTVVFYFIIQTLSTVVFDCSYVCHLQWQLLLLHFIWSTSL